MLPTFIPIDLNSFTTHISIPTIKNNFIITIKTFFYANNSSYYNRPVKGIELYNSTFPLRGNFQLVPVITTTTIISISVIVITFMSIIITTSSIVFFVVITIISVFTLISFQQLQFLYLLFFSIIILAITLANSL